MYCPKCSESVETSARFCGNCGAQLKAAPPVAEAPGAAPAYAVTHPNAHHGETQAVLSIVFGVLGVVGAFLVPLFGITLGITGLVFGTMARERLRRTMSTVGIVVASLSIVVGLATWAQAVASNQHENDLAETNGASSAVASVSTPCYEAGFAQKLTVKHTEGSCTMSAFNGKAAEDSTELFKVYANKNTFRDLGHFQAEAKEAIERDIENNLQGFTVTHQEPTTFAGSPAYVVHAKSDTKRLSTTEAVVWRQGSKGYNVFVLVHAASSDKTDLNALEAQWTWK